MKLVKIKDVRVGQVRKIIIMDFNAENTKEVIGVFTRANDSDYDMFDWIAEYYDVETKMSLGDYEDWTFEDCGELIGKINITHKIEDNKLVEITRENPLTCEKRMREDLVIDDIIEFYAIGFEHQKLIGSVITNYYYSKIFTGKEIKEPFQPEWILNKIGIYGVTHEFVNDGEVRDDNS